MSINKSELGYSKINKMDEIVKMKAPKELVTMIRTVRMINVGIFPKNDDLVIDKIIARKQLLYV